MRETLLGHSMGCHPDWQLRDVTCRAVEVLSNVDAVVARKERTARAC